MDDANVPSLLAMPYLGDVERTDPIYENTRRFVWSDGNPYFWRGAAGEGIGGPPYRCGDDLAHEHHDAGLHLHRRRGNP